MVALLLLALRGLDIEVRFDTSLQTPLMLAFFATIGLSADFASLKKGGRVVGVFLLAVIGLLALAPRNRRHPAVRCDGTRPCIAQFG